MAQPLTINFTGCPLPMGLAEAGPEIPQVAVREIFGALWFKKGCAPDANLSDEDYRQSLNAKEKYEHESNEILSTLMTGNILNARNLWTISVMMPLFLTTAQHFHVNHEEWNNLPYTPKAEGGTDNQITYNEWQTKDSVGPIVSQSTDISVRLSRDANWGFETWKKNLTQLNRNLTMTLMLGAIQDVRDVAYFQLVTDQEKRFCAEQLFAAEGHDTFLAAKNADAFLDECNKVIGTHPGVHLLVVSPMGSRFLSNSKYPVSQRHLTAKEISYNPQLKRLVAKNHQGPLSLMTFHLSQGPLDVVEITPFVTRHDDPTPYNPLATTMSNCQFFGPNPFLRATDRVKSTRSEVLDTWISDQSQARCVVRCVEFAEQLANCFYWDRATGEISSYVDRCIAEMNARRTQDGVPVQFRAGTGSQNVNDDTGDYATPPLDAKNYTGELQKLKSFREMPAICMWDPEAGRYRRVERLGDNNLCVLPHKWMAPGVDALHIAFREQTGKYPSQIVARIKSWVDSCTRAPPSQAYLEALIDANMPAVVRDGPVTVNGIKEFQPNANGSLNLPLNEDGALTGMQWASGFQSGAGMLTARDAHLQPGNPFTEMCQEAGECLKDVTLWIDFLAKNLGDTDVINPAYAKPWFLEKNAETTFIDALFPGGEPVFLGVPATAVRSPDVVPLVRDALPNLDALRALLQETPIDAVSTDMIIGALNAGSLVDASIQALACLSADQADLVKDVLLGVALLNPATAVTAAFIDAAQALFSFVIKTSAFPRKFQGAKETSDMRAQRKIVTSVAVSFVALVRPALRDGDEDARLSVIAQAKADVVVLSDRVRGKERMAGIMAGAGYASDVPPLAPRLVQAQKSATGGAFGDGVPLRVSERDAQLRDEAYLAGRDARTSVAYFDGDYSVRPLEYMRSSLMSSPALEAFIATTGNVWALPGDPASNYTTPNFRVADLRRARFERNTVVKMEAALPIKAHLSAFQSLMGKLRTVGRGTSSAGSGASGASRGTSRAMALERRRRPTAASLYDFGARPSAAQDDEYDEMEEELYRTPKSTGAPQSDADAEEAVMREHFYGPWASRMAAAEQIKDDFDRLNYKALLQTPNTLDFHTRQAALGVSYINLVMLRPFGRYKVSSALLMGTGEDVMAKPISPVDVDISKNRDQFRVECTVEHGKLVIDATKIHMKYGAFPEEYQGGKNCEFVTSPQQYTLDDQYKPSIIVIPVPKDEYQHSATIHLLNRPLVRQTNRAKRVDPMAKWSGAAFFVSVFGRDACDLAETLQHERYTYNKPCVLSHFAHAGPRSVFDPKTQQQVKVDGFGAVNSWAMNGPDCVKVFQQISSEFTEDYRAINSAYRV
jgi:hypothetical protein